MTNQRHVPVLMDRVVALLAPALERPGAVMIDATLGHGGHSEAVLRALPDVRVIGVDRDPSALQLANDRLTPFAERVSFVHAVYDELADVLTDQGLTSVDAVLFDLGVSSMQLDETDRGFAYAHNAPLDMRMDTTASLTAADVLNTYDERNLARILQQYGEEKFARRIARSIVAERSVAPFTDSQRLVDLLYAAIPAPARRTGGHPAKRTFQALRIEVNDELAVLRRAMPAALDAIPVGGRVVVEAYQSLEDRIVKHAFAEAVRTDIPDDLPFVPAGSEPEFRLVTRGAEMAVEPELSDNPRAASVRLRAIERTRTSGAVA